MLTGPLSSLMAGFPPEPEARVTLANWQEPPYNRWSFRHLREVIPTQRISRGDGPARPLPTASHEFAVDEVPVDRIAGHESTFAEVLADTWTDSVLIMHRDHVVLERYSTGMRRDTPHLLMSVSKSVVGCVAGMLVEQGLLDPADQISERVPEVAGSGYDGATVRHLLDMRTGVAFSEAYDDPNSGVRVIERHIGWQPGGDPDDGGLYGYLASVSADASHGGAFVYRSADTDMLGWVCERASGARMADLIATLLWQPLGAEYDAEITCDPLGSAAHDGGMCATTRDLARFGQMLLHGGCVGDRSVVPEKWLVDAWEADADVRAAFADCDSEPYLPGGWYRNQFWFVPGPSGDIQLCLGIHGQMVLVDRATDTVAVKLSSWPNAQNGGYLIDTIRAFAAVGQQLARDTATHPAPG